jgi:hypothetical protein
MLSYENKKGKIILVTVKRHAYAQFFERYKLALPKKDLQNAQVPAELERLFSQAKKVTNLSRKEKTRLRRYGDDTMFFRTNIFTFIVQNKCIVTVELSDANMRHLNKRHHQTPKNLVL